MHGNLSKHWLTKKAEPAWTRKWENEASNYPAARRQRIAIARIFLKDAPILVLDEATSALDSEVEAAIQENLFELMAEKTVIAIAHRLSTISQLDRLIVMENGAIAEAGTHSQLVAQKGIYADLWTRQSGGFLTKPMTDKVITNAAQ